MAVEVFPALSATVQTTVVTPEGKTAGALLVTEATPQLSEVAGAPRFEMAVSQVKVGKTEIAAGAVIKGFSLSVIVTV